MIFDMMTISFQFQQVQFRGENGVNRCFIKVVSIPIGTIQRSIHALLQLSQIAFQFQQVRFREKLSIPTLPSEIKFQFQQVQFRASVISSFSLKYLRFNSNRYNSEKDTNTHHNISHHVSIPIGTIQSLWAYYHEPFITGFQFQQVQFREAEPLAPCDCILVSIPIGTIQRRMIDEIMNLYAQVSIPIGTIQS